MVEPAFTISHLWQVTCHWCKMNVFCAGVFFLAATSITITNGQQSRVALINDLMSSYDKRVRPVINSYPTQVNVSVILQNLIEMVCECHNCKHIKFQDSKLQSARMQVYIMYVSWKLWHW
jgi:hypothetical protein